MSYKLHLLAISFLAATIASHKARLDGAPPPLHAYEFSGSLADSGSGGIDILSEGGVVGPEYYDFNPQYPGDFNQGLTLVGTALSNAGVYSMEMRIKYDRLRNETPPGTYGPDQSWIKTIDYTDGLYSYGLYVEDVIRWEGPGEEGLIEFIASTENPPYYDYPGISPDGVILADTWFHVVVTRELSGLFKCFIDGEKVFQFQDTMNDAVVDANRNTLRFFQPDEQAILEYNVYEVTKGSIDYLRIYDQALSEQDAISLFEPFPPGDFNQDHEVDGDDLAIWQSGYGINDTGDGDEDGDTDGRDFLIWQRNFGTSSVATLVVPEPSAACLLTLLGAVSVLPIRHQR
jgi:hypothetical protein